MDYDKIGKFITASRKEKELTQNELAEKLNITDRAVSRWERGKGCPDISLLEDLSKILDVSIIELLKGEKLNNKQKLEKEELIYSMNYAKESTKIKMYKVLNNIIVTLIFVVILTIAFNNLKVAVLLNHHYYPNIMFIDVGDIDSQNLFSNIEKKIESIKKDDRYKSKEDVNKIIDIIENNLTEDEKLYNKKYYTFTDIKNLVYKDSNDMNNITKLTINNIGNQNYNWNDEILSYTDAYYDHERSLKYFINNSYKYNYYKITDESIGNQAKQYLNEKYYIYSMILDDVIKGGEVDE